jgi:hypothetical protein
MRQTAIALSLIFLSGCAAGYKASYVTGAVTKEVVTETYSPYSEEFNKKIDECCSGDVCNPQSSDVITKTQLDKCMGSKFESSTHEKIEAAVKMYHEASKAFTEVMKLVDASDEQRKAATSALFESALNMLELIPGGNKQVAKLKKMTGR